MGKMIIQTAGPAAAVQETGNISDMMAEFVRFIDRSDKTARTYLCNLRQFDAWLHWRGISRPGRSDVLAYRDWLLADHDAIKTSSCPAGWEYRTDSAGRPLKIRCKPATAALYLRSVGQFFRWTASSGRYPDIAANVHPPRIASGIHKKDALDARELLAIEDGISATAAARAARIGKDTKDAAGRLQRITEQEARLTAMFSLAVNAGLRTIELHRANVRDFVTRGGQAWLYVHGKGHTEADQRRPIAREVADSLRAYLQIRKDSPTGSSPLFVSTGNRAAGQRIAPTTISTMLKRAMQAAGYDSERLTAHSLRHSTGTAVLKITGNNIFETQHFMRHSSPTTTEIYTHADTEAQEAATAQRLYDYIHGKAAGSLFNGMTAEEIAQAVQMVSAAAAAARAGK